jgi:hypothetical protein
MARHRRDSKIFLAILASGWLAGAPAGEPAAEGDAGEPAPSLGVTIRLEGDGLKVGDPAPIRVTITNRGKVPYRYTERSYDRGGRMEEYRLEAVAPGGAPAPDPRARRQGGIGGGLGQEALLAPGASFDKTIDLNRWALLRKPGAYRVKGIYLAESGGKEFASEPIEVPLAPRNGKEMEALVADLSARLAKASAEDERVRLAHALMYTGDRHIVPPLIEALYRRDAASFWAIEAFLYYLPVEDKEATDALLAAASRRGMAPGTLYVLKGRGVAEERIYALIETSLSPEHPVSWAEGALAAQESGQDRFVPRLIAIALDPKSPARMQAIYALALNRTDEGVTALGSLLREPHPLEVKGYTIRQATEDAIRAGYLYRGNSKGKPLRPDDFPPELQRPADPTPAAR